MVALFFDLDGAIHNSQKRLYTLFCELCPENTFSYEEYWNIKRQRITQKQMLQEYYNYDDKQIAIFKTSLLEKVEEEEHMTHDTPVEEIESILEKLYTRHTLYIVTHRQDEIKTLQQIHFLGWNKFFKKIFVTQQKTTKQQLIIENVSITPYDVFIYCCYIILLYQYIYHFLSWQ